MREPPLTMTRKENPGLEKGETVWGKKRPSIIIGLKEVRNIQL